MAGCIQVVGEAAQDQDQLEGTTIVPAGETAQDRPIALRFCAKAFSPPQVHAQVLTRALGPKPMTALILIHRPQHG